MIGGPTASGKSGLALQLAQHFHAEIFSADSRQIYKEISVGTAKPTVSELASVTHHFINHVSVSEPYSVGKYIVEIRKKLAGYFEKSEVAIVVGGTGLYLRALLEGIDDLPPSDRNIIRELEAGFEKNGIQFLQDMLQNLDPDYYKIVDKYNPRRLIRALSVSISQNKPYSSLLGKNKKQLTPPAHVIGIILNPPRPLLYERINDRVDEMICKGLEEEVKSMVPFRHHDALKTVGYNEFFEFFDGKITREEAIALIKQNSRRYAKRQVTWFKKYGAGQFFEEINSEKIMEYILQKMNYTK